MTDVRGACKVCGYVSHLGAVAQHHIIPRDVTKQAGMPESATVNLCCNCHFELYEKIKDYESAFNEFRKYRDEQKKSVRESK